MREKRFMAAKRAWAESGEEGRLECAGKRESLPLPTCRTHVMNCDGEAPMMHVFSPSCYAATTTTTTIIGIIATNITISTPYLCQDHQLSLPFLPSLSLYS